LIGRLYIDRNVNIDGGEALTNKEKKETRASIVQTVIVVVFVVGVPRVVDALYGPIGLLDYAIFGAIGGFVSWLVLKLWQKIKPGEKETSNIDN